MTPSNSMPGGTGKERTTAMSTTAETTIHDLADQYEMHANSVARIITDNLGLALGDDEYGDPIVTTPEIVAAFAAFVDGPHTLCILDDEGTVIETRPATREQVIASFDIADTGLIWVDADNDWVPDGASFTPAEPVRAAYVEA